MVYFQTVQDHIQAMHPEALTQSSCDQHIMEAEAINWSSTDPHPYYYDAIPAELSMSLPCQTSTSRKFNVSVEFYIPSQQHSGPFLDYANLLDCTTTQCSIRPQWRHQTIGFGAPWSPAKLCQ